MKKALFWIIIVALLGVFAYSSYQIGGYLLEKRRSDKSVEEVARYVRVPDGYGAKKDGVSDGNEEDPNRIEVDFDALWEINSDVVAWLVSPDTGINYPVLQAPDNDYYLHRLIDGNWNDNGSLFLDYRCSGDFSDENSIIYGHNMRSGAMFGNLVKYKDQNYYDEHSDIYLVTPERQYRLDLFAGCIIESDADIYQNHVSQEYLQRCIARSTFQPDHVVVPEGPILTLSTCSYEFQNARYVVLGVLVPTD